MAENSGKFIFIQKFAFFASKNLLNTPFFGQISEKLPKIDNLTKNAVFKGFFEAKNANFWIKMNFPEFSAINMIKASF